MVAAAGGVARSRRMRRPGSVWRVEVSMSHRQTPGGRKAATVRSEMLMPYFMALLDDYIAEYSKNHKNIE